MKWLVRIVGGLLVLVGVLAVIGLLLPAQFKVQRSTIVAAPAPKVYALIASPAEWKRWTVWNQRDPNMKIEYAGPAAGRGAKWSWDSKTEGRGAMEFTGAQPDSGITYRLTFPDFGMESTGMLKIAPAGNGVQVTWTNEGQLSANPLNRWFGLFMDSLVGPDFEAGLANLKRLAETG